METKDPNRNWPGHPNQVSVTPHLGPRRTCTLFSHLKRGIKRIHQVARRHRAHTHTQLGPRPSPLVALPPAATGMMMMDLDLDLEPTSTEHSSVSSSFIFLFWLCFGSGKTVSIMSEVR
jgi:hypothetical protein